MRKVCKASNEDIIEIESGESTEGKDLETIAGEVSFAVEREYFCDVMGTISSIESKESFSLFRVGSMDIFKSALLSFISVSDENKTEKQNSTASVEEKSEVKLVPSLKNDLDDKSNSSIENVEIIQGHSSDSQEKINKSTGISVDNQPYGVLPGNKIVDHGKKSVNFLNSEIINASHSLSLNNQGGVDVKVELGKHEEKFVRGRQNIF